MKTLRDIIIERLIQNKKLEKPSVNDMNDYVSDIQLFPDYDLLDEFEQMVTGNT
jgi:hypothetical protein